MLSWIIGAVGAMLVAGAAYRRQSLSLTGMIAAFVMGTVYFGAGNAFWFGILLIFSSPPACSRSFTMRTRRSLS